MNNQKVKLIDSILVEKLIRKHFPKWANLPIMPVKLSGSDNMTFHLGSEMLVRLPSGAKYSAQVEKEQLWLPKLAPLLPLPIPRSLALGMPSETSFPWHWSIYGWLEGKTASLGNISDLNLFATSLAEFLVAFHQIDATQGAPRRGTQLL